MHLSIMLPFRTKEKKGHLQGHSPLVMMFVTNHAKLRSKCQQFQYPSSSQKIHNLTQVYRRFKGLISSLRKGNMTGLLARLDTATAEYYEYLLHSYSEGKNDIFYTEGTEFQFSTPTQNMPGY